MRIRIKPLTIRKQDTRGVAYSFRIPKREDFLLLTINKGKVRGRHYHLGKSRSKNPEKLFLLSGKAKIMAKDIKTEKSKTFILDKPSAIWIYPFVYHEVHGITDCMLLEANMGAYPRGDTIWPFGRTKS